MSQSDSESDPPESAPISSGEVETPRGGFMARPGLKAPPRHAVVVRVGDAPDLGHIPLARSSFPPPPPAAPPPASPNDKITVRAIPTPRPPATVNADADANAQAGAPAKPSQSPSAPSQAGESAPPPSDAPVVASVLEDRVTLTPRSRRAIRSRLTILAAAAAGLVLGIISVVTTVRVREATQSAPLAASFEPTSPASEASLNAVPAPSIAAAPKPAPAAPTPASSQLQLSGNGANGAAEADSTLAPAAAKPPTSKQSIF